LKNEYNNFCGLTVYSECVYILVPLKNILLFSLRAEGVAIHFLLWIATLLAKTRKLYFFQIITVSIFIIQSYSIIKNSKLRKK